jgi:hypothetical protein
METRAIPLRPTPTGVRLLGFMTGIAFARRHAVEDAGGLDATEIDALNHHLRHRLGNRHYHEPFDLAAERLEARSPTTILTCWTAGRRNPRIA